MEEQWRASEGKAGTGGGRRKKGRGKMKLISIGSRDYGS